MKLTEAQRQLLGRMKNGASLSYDKLHGSIWSSDGRFTIKVRASTFNSLTVRNLIGPWITEGDTTGYRITPAGIAALEESNG